MVNESYNTRHSWVEVCGTPYSLRVVQTMNLSQFVSGVSRTPDRFRRELPRLSTGDGADWCSNVLNRRHVLQTSHRCKESVSGEDVKPENVVLSERQRIRFTFEEKSFPIPLFLFQSSENKVYTIKELYKQSLI